MVLIGWGRHLRDRGAAYPVECDHCEREVYQHLVSRRRWLSVLFFRVIPLSGVSYSLVCPNCNRTRVLDDGGEIQNAKLANELAYQHHNHAIDTQSFFIEMERLITESDIVDVPRGFGNQVRSTVSETDSTRIGFQ